MTTSDQFSGPTDRRSEPTLPIAQVPVAPRQRAVTGAGLVAASRRSSTQASGRRCAHVEDGRPCGTILSIYNSSDRCSVHCSVEQRRPRGTHHHR